MPLATPQLSADAIRMMNAMAAIGYKDAGTTAGAQLHGPAGLLATPGLNKQIMNAMILPRGLAGRLPVRPSIDTNEIFGILTGLTASTGNEPTADCTDWPLVGQFKLCRQQTPFGQQGRMSQVLNIKHAGEIVNRGEFRDNVLFGQPDTTPAAGALPGTLNWGRILQTEYEKKLGELFAGYYRDYARNLYTGNPLNTGAAGYKQYRGLDLQINTGKRDTTNGVACPAADSIVIDVNGASVNTAGGTIYNALANIMLNLELLAQRLSLDVKWGIVMRQGAFWTITNVWPCVYATTNCLVGASIVRTQSLNEAVEMRDAMRNGMYLPIEGKNYEVIVDDAVAETIAAGGVVGTYQSDIYIVPLTANGEPMLFWEYFTFNEQAIAAGAAMAPQGFFSALDNGRFLFVKLAPTHTCVQVEIIERPRLILYAPFLAARLTSVRYTYSIHERDAFPTDTYFVNGGLPVTPQPYFYPNGGAGA